MKKILKIYPTNRLWQAIAVLVAGFVLGHFIPLLFVITTIAFWGVIVAIISEVLLLFTAPNGIVLNKHIPVRLSNGDDNIIHYEINSNYPFNVHLTVLDELPFVFGRESRIQPFWLKAKNNLRLSYVLRPTKRGELEFGYTNVYTSVFLRLISYRYKLGTPCNVAVYPSFLQMRRFELMAISNRLTEIGVKHVRQRGSQFEFDTISNYVQGDEYRKINWRATARRDEIMVNRYEEERAQPIYCLIDSGRSMKMPFEGMSLLDYAINSCLVLANIALIKGDRAGLITFDNAIRTVVPAERKPGHISIFQNALYNLKTSFLEPNYEGLNGFIHRKINHRSLLILFSNFETLYAMRRNQKVLQILSQRHLLLVVLFENTELVNLRNKTANSLSDIYIETATEKLLFEKRIIASELKKLGILTILCKPIDLSVTLINKYLEIKANYSI